MATKKPERRRSSGRYNIVNPLEGTSAAALESLTNVSAAPNKDGSRVHTSNQGPLAVTAADRPISQDDFMALQRTLESLSDNEEILRHLAASLHRRLFTSVQIKSLIETTPSVKTRLQMVDSLGPRCTNPGEATAIVDSFRFTAEKAHVSELLHARERVLKANALTPSVRTREVTGRGGAAARGGGMSGRGGRGRGGKGAGSRPSTLVVERIEEASGAESAAESSDDEAGNAEGLRGSIAVSVREIRKTAASLTGLHGLLSGKKGSERASIVSAPESVAPPQPGATLSQPPDKAPPPPPPPPTIISQQPEIVSTPPPNVLPPTVEAQTPSVPVSNLSSSELAPETTQLPSVPAASTVAAAAPPLVDSPLPPHALPPRPTQAPPPQRPRPSCSLALPPPPSAVPAPAPIAETPIIAVTPSVVVASAADASPVTPGSTPVAGSESEESAPAKVIRYRAASLLFSAVKEADDEDDEEDHSSSLPAEEDQTNASQSPATTRTEFDSGSARSGRVSIFGALTRGRSGSEAAWNSHLTTEPVDRLRSASTLTAPSAVMTEPSHRGWVHLRSGMFMASWEVLYFVLSREKEGGFYFLFYYKEAWGGKTGQAPSGKIALHGARVESPTTSTDSWFPFTITTSAGKAHSLRVTTEDERILWCQMITQALSSM